MYKEDLKSLEKANIIANFERAVEEARHYIAMDVDTFAIKVGDIVIRREK